MKEITVREKQLLQFIQDYMVKNNVTPTIRDMCEGMGFSSTSTIHHRFQRLIDLGYITQVGERYKVEGVKYVEDK